MYAAPPWVAVFVVNTLFSSLVFVFDSILSAPPYGALLLVKLLSVSIASPIMYAAPPLSFAVLCCMLFCVIIPLLDPVPVFIAPPFSKAVLLFIEFFSMV